MDNLLKSVVLIALGAAGYHFYINRDKKNPEAELEEALEAELARRDSLREAREMLPLQPSHNYHHQITHGLY